jgi:hypothetical protein
MSSRTSHRNSTSPENKAWSDVGFGVMPIAVNADGEPAIKSSAYFLYEVLYVSASATLHAVHTACRLPALSLQLLA